MRAALFIVCTLSIQSCLAQSYAETMDRCTKLFTKGLSEIPQEKMGMEMHTRTSALRECIIGQKFPAFQLASMKNKKYSAAELEGKVIMINLWFISCPPCVAEMPLLNELQKEYKKKNFLILSFATDDENAIREFMSKRTIDYEIFPQANDVIEKTFKMSFGYPTNLFLNKHGEIVEFKVGGAMEEVGLKQTKMVFKKIIDSELAK